MSKEVAIKGIWRGGGVEKGLAFCAVVRSYAQGKSVFSTHLKNY